MIKDVIAVDFKLLISQGSDAQANSERRTRTPHLEDAIATKSDDGCGRAGLEIFVPLC